MAQIRAKFEGQKELLASLRRLERVAPFALAAAMFEEGVEIFNESQEQVPVDSGRLRASGLVALRDFTTTLAVVIGYGTAYALRIHEDTALDANRTMPGESSGGGSVSNKTTGKSKFLIDPFNEAASGLATRLAIRTRGHILRGRILGFGTIRPVKGSRNR